MNKTLFIALLAPIFALGCGHGDEPIGGNESEVITTVELSFTPEGGGSPIVAVFNDPDGDGGDPPMVDAIQLDAGIYTASVRFENRLEEPSEDITLEVADESQEHQIFFTGSAVDGPASNTPGAPLAHSYSDQDINDLPIGLINAIVASSGSGELTVTLRHLPPLGGEKVKTADLSTRVQEAGFSAIGGSSDAQVTFSVTVQ